MSSRLHRLANRSPNLSSVAFWAAFGLLSALALVPLWCVRIPPMQDIWQHLALVDVIHNYDAPGSIYPDYFLLPSSPKPNLIYYYLTDLIAYLAPLETANKVVISLYILGFPASALYLFKSFGRSRWLSFFAFPLIYNAMFGYGFASFLLAMPLLLLGVGVYRRFVAGEGDDLRLRHGGIAAAVMVAAFFTHAHVFLLLCFLCGMLLLMHRDGFWGTLYRAWPFAPAMVFFIPWFCVFFLEQTPSTSGIQFGTARSVFGPTYYKPSYILSSFYRYLGEYFNNEVDDGVFVLMMLLALVLLMFRRAPSIPPPNGTGLSGWRDAVRRVIGFFRSGRFAPRFDLEILTLVLGLSVLLLPHHIESQAIVSTRHIVFTALFFFGWLGFDAAPRTLRAAAVVGLVLLEFVTVGNLVKGFREFEKELDGYPALFEAADGGKRLLKQAYSQESKVVQHGALWHIHFFYMLEKGGISDVQFAEYPHNPIQYRPGVVPPKPPIEFARAASWRYFDYVLLRKSSSPSIAAVDDELEMVADVADWALYKVLDYPKPRPADCPAPQKERRGPAGTSPSSPLPAVTPPITPTAPAVPVTPPSVRAPPAAGVAPASDAAGPGARGRTMLPRLPANLLRNIRPGPPVIP